MRDGESLIRIRSNLAPFLRICIRMNTNPKHLSKEFDWRPVLKENERVYKRARHLFDEFLDQIALNASGANSKGTDFHFFSAET